MEGMGTYYYTNGDRYCGAWEKGVKQGRGTYCYAKGETMVTGQFVDGKCSDGTWEFYDGQKPFTATFSTEPRSIVYAE